MAAEANQLRDVAKLFQGGCSGSTAFTPKPRDLVNKSWQFVLFPLWQDLEGETRALEDWDLSSA